MALARVKYYRYSRRHSQLSFLMVGLPFFSVFGMLIMFYPEALVALFDCLGGGVIFGLFVLLVLLFYRLSRRLRCPFCGARAVSLELSTKRSSGHMLLVCDACKRKAVTDILFYEMPSSTRHQYIQDTRFEERF